jgi:hypothetical protein
LILIESCHVQRSSGYPAAARLEKHGEEQNEESWLHRGPPPSPVTTSTGRDAQSAQGTRLSQQLWRTIPPVSDSTQEQVFALNVDLSSTVGAPRSYQTKHVALDGINPDCSPPLNPVVAHLNGLRHASSESSAAFQRRPSPKIQPVPIFRPQTWSRWVHHRFRPTMPARRELG